MNNNIVRLRIVYHIWDKSVSNVLRVIAVHKVPRAAELFKLVSTFGLMTENQPYISIRDRRSNYPVPEKVREAFETRGVYVDIVLVNPSGSDLCDRKLVIQFITVINDLALIQSLHPTFSTYFVSV